MFRAEEINFSFFSRIERGSFSEIDNFLYIIKGQIHTDMAQENDNDLNTSFSTLNVNAMEFVPNFGSTFCTPTPTATKMNTDENEDAISTPTAAIPTETISDKTPENAGE